MGKGVIFANILGSATQEEESVHSVQRASDRNVPVMLNKSKKTNVSLLKYLKCF